MVFADDDPEIVLIQDDDTDDVLLGSSGSGIFPSSNSASAIEQFRDGSKIKRSRLVPQPNGRKGQRAPTGSRARAFRLAAAPHDGSEPEADEVGDVANAGCADHAVIL